MPSLSYWAVTVREEFSFPKLSPMDLDLAQQSGCATTTSFSVALTLAPSFLLHLATCHQLRGSSIQGGGPAACLAWASPWRTVTLKLLWSGQSPKGIPPGQCPLGRPALFCPCWRPRGKLYGVESTDGEDEGTLEVSLLIRMQNDRHW